MSLVTVAEYASRLDADLARLKLFGEGIDAHIMDAGMASLGLGFMTPARLMVLPEDESCAREILARYAAEQERLAASGVTSADDDGSDDERPDGKRISPWA